MATVDHSNWHVEYEGSAKGPLRLGRCDYAGVEVIYSAVVPYVYVDYLTSPPGPFTDQLACRDDVEFRETMNGFDLKATYDFGADYLYEHIWRFHDDGQFGSAMVIHGPGEEIRGRHTYHLPWRFDFDVGGAGGDCFQYRFGGTEWADLGREGRVRPSHPPEFEWRVLDNASGRNVQARSRVGDSAEAWALSYKRSESFSAFGATGSGPPGAPHSVPAIYDNDEPLQNTDVVFWYIAHIPAIDRVSVCGPWFALDRYPAVQPEPADHDHQHEEPPGEPQLNPVHFKELPGVAPPKRRHSGDTTNISYLGHQIVIRAAAAEGHDMPGMARGDDHGAMTAHYEFTVDGGEPLAVHEEAGVFHMHMYPFVVFASVEDAALEWVKQIYGSARGRS